MVLLAHSFLEEFVTRVCEEDTSSKMWHNEELIRKESD